MKKILLIIVFVILNILFLESYICFANNNENITYENFSKDISEFDKSELLEQNSDLSKNRNIISDIAIKAKSFMLDQLKKSWKMLLKIIIVCFLSSLIKAYVSDKSFTDIAFYGCYCTIAYIFIENFVSVSRLCSENIEDIGDFMKFVIPTYASTLAMSGYTAQATTVQGVFMGAAVMIIQIIIKFIIPLLFCCAMVVIINNMSTVLNLSKLVSTISKAVKYSMGILMIFFAGAISLSGFSNASVDNVAIKTAKYAVANFVPNVGGCLSEALHSVINSSSVLKNSMGYLCYITLISICLFPVIKIALTIFMFRISASVGETIGDSKIGEMINSLTDILSAMFGLLLLSIVMFILMIGVIAATG